MPAARGGGFIGLRWRIEPAFGGEFTGPCIQTVRFIGGRDPDVSLPGFRQKLVELLVKDGHAIDAAHPALRSLLPVFRDTWREVLAAEWRWNDELMTGGYPEPPADQAGASHGECGDAANNRSAAPAPTRPAQGIPDERDTLNANSPFSALVAYYTPLRSEPENP